MKGMELSRKYWEELGRPAFETGCPEVLEKASVGLVGEGSECFGFDDEISRDHDWGPGFCVWLSDADMKDFGMKAASVYAALPEDFMGFKRLNVSAMTQGRVGVMSSGSFYARYTGFDRVPASIYEWRCVPESGLAVATNGEVFQEGCTDFARVREGLLGFFPNDLRKKKLAMHCALAAQSGQYNYSRCAHRGEMVAAFIALSEFIKHVQSVIFLLNRRYMPYYKWTHKAMKTLPLLGMALAPRIERLIGNEEYPVKIDLIEDISSQIIMVLKQQHLSGSDSDFLLNHAESIQGRIEDPQLRQMHIMSE